jgi:hypothetical protein
LVLQTNGDNLVVLTPSIVRKSLLRLLHFLSCFDRPPLLVDQLSQVILSVTARASGNSSSSSGSAGVATKLPFTSAQLGTLKASHLVLQTEAMY